MSKSIGKIFGTGPYVNFNNNVSDNFNNGINESPSAERVQQLLNNTPIAQNNFANVPLNQQIANNPNYISDEDLLAKMWKNIKEYEQVIPYPYLDTKGTITVGPGKNANTLEEFMSVRFNNVSEKEQEKYFYILRDMGMAVDENNRFKYHNTKARDFEQYTPLRISDEESYRLAQNHMTNDLNHVRQQFSDFDRFPEPLKEVLLDIQYNTGNLTRNNWPKLYQAIENRDVNGIVQNVHRKDVGKQRNEWAERMAGSIRF